MKYKVKSEDCRIVVAVKMSRGETVDEKELDRFARIYLRGFLRPKQIKKNRLEYTGPIGISLYERLKKPVTKREFLFIIEQIVVAVQKLRSNSLPLNNMVMQVQNVFINEVTKEVQFIYMPMKKGQNNSNLIDFVESVIYSVKTADERDNDFILRFIYFFRGLKPFDINEVEKFVAKEDSSVVNTIKKQNAGQSGFMTNKQQNYYDHYDKNRADIVDGEATGLLDDEATGLLNDDNDATGLLSDDGENDTALLDENRVGAHFPTLFRLTTQETIAINKPVYRIGKEKSYSDYFVADNIAVSRSHADIITRGNKYFVIDLNSKNHTYINGQEIPINCEVEISDGNSLRLADEEFVFSI